MVLFSFLLVGSCLGLFLYYIIDYFQTDKRAYLFEDAFRFGLEANASFEGSAAFGKLLSKTLIDPKEINFSDLQHDLIAIRFEPKKAKRLYPWVYNKTAIKQLGLPESDFLGSFNTKDEITFLPAPDLRSGYFRLLREGPNLNSILAIYPEDFFELLNTRKYAQVSIVDHSNKAILFKSPGFPEHFDPSIFSRTTEQARSFEKEIAKTKYFITSHYSKMTNTSMVILYNMDEANATLAFLSKTLIWVAVGMFGLGLILSTIFAKSLAKPLELLADMSRRVSDGDLEARVSFKSTDETGLLASSFNTMMDKIQTFIEELKGKARLESELKLASLVQRNFFDLTPLDTPTFHIKGDYISASECAGDWWSVKNWNGKYILLLGDATGHGAPSALLTSAVFSAIECIEHEITQKDNWWERPDEILLRLNQVVIAMSKDIMMTFIAGIYDPDTNKMWLTNASHEIPVIYNLNNPPKATNEIGFLISDPGPRLGDTESPDFIVKEFQLKPNDRMIFYSDGLIESLVEPGKNFSTRFFLKRIIKMGNLPINESLPLLIELPADGHPNDDISFFVMDIKETSVKKDLITKIPSERNFILHPPSNEFGFLVGHLESEALEKLAGPFINDWHGALIANAKRARSESFENYIESFGALRSSVKERLRFAIDELIMNGEYHGKSKGHVLVHIERKNTGFWLKSRDNGGSFLQPAVEKLYKTVFEETLTVSEEGKGAGIGLGMIIKMSEHFIIYVTPSNETIVSCYIPDKTAERLLSFSYIVNQS